MILLSRFSRTLACLLPLLLLPVAAPAPAKEQVPWLYKGSDVPPDREWTFGELSNGMRYAVRNNGVPPGQVSIRINIDAGSLNETDEEQGFAHLLEHLLFRQSKYLGNGEAIPTWQRLGASFGNDTNAETTPTHTVFKLDLPNATPAALDESFKLLSGMVTAPTLSEANIRTEVPIVLAEMRERGGAAQRVQDASRKVFYAGQPLASRAPIGTVATLNGAHQDAVRAFHARWYRPETTTIVVAGDISPAESAALIKKWFADWKVAGKPTSAPSYGDPVAPKDADPANPVGETQVLVEPDLPRNISYAILRPWRKVNDTIVYNQGLMTDSLAQAIINRRLEAKARAGGSYLVAQVSQDNVSRSVDGTFVSVTPLGDDWQAAVKDVRAVIADALATPPSQEEIDREIAEMEVAFQTPVEQYKLLPGSRVADDLINALDIRETVAAPDAVLSIFQKSKLLFTPQAVLDHTRKLFKGTVTRALLVTPKSGEGDAGALRQALLTPVTGDASVRLAGKPIRFDEMPPIGEPGRLTALAPMGLLGIEQIEFANGVKVMMWPTQDEPGRVAVKVRFGGGYRSFASGDAPYIALGQMALVGSGEGTLGQEELDRISTGRKMGFDFSIEDAAFEFSADTRQADLADQLYIFAAKFAMPRWDANPVLRAKAAARLQYETYATSPQGVLERDLKYLQRDRDPRFRMPPPAELDQATVDGFKKVWSRALANGPIEVQVYGDFDRVETIAALQRTFGALKTRLPLPKDTAPATARFPAGNGQPVVLTHRGDANQAAAVVSWPTGGGSIGITESRKIEILTQLFTDRLLQAMREKLGASYAPQVYSTWPLDLDSGGSITAMAQLQPDGVSAFFTTAQEIAADLVAKPVTADELERVVEPLRQRITRASTSAAFFMYQLEGATADPSRVAGIRSILHDYTVTTPAEMQELAARYLQPGKSWRLAVLPQQQTGAPATPAVR
ncbi:insulinase family protein [Novosphingobium sp. G106]|uniref:M16 family metallopeptidase n=1 Tax=Novosphingobium sp. G106 TaxID=2849500 RepID=UPI001C2CCF23|nr:M16 family metallopeptidase [Novosphingobium sp. G106]MBV1686644.1 insulinase family protein [Novosphingobium sp. G106]